MNKKVILLLVVTTGLIVGIILVVFRNQERDSLTNPLTEKSALTKITPSETLIEYQDPSGFTFSYPDNLSLDKKETEDESIYADLQLSAKVVNGSLILKIADSKFKTIEEWVKINQTSSQEDPKEVKLGNLKASEVRLNDRILLGALDQEVLFTIEMPRIEEEFWMKVYQKILESFSFTTPQTENLGSTDDVIFEGEEVVE